jgi:subtilisin family serine protease
MAEMNALLRADRPRDGAGYAETALAQRLGHLFVDTRTRIERVVWPEPGLVVVTDTLIIDDARTKEIDWLCKRFRLKHLEEGYQGKVLLKAREDEGDRATEVVFEAAVAANQRGKVGAAQPNFALILDNTKTSQVPSPLWHQHNGGKPGVRGADDAARAAWTITRGRSETRVAILDDGVDTEHPALRATVVAEKDFVNNNEHARPETEDPHGTACAGIIFSRDEEYPGLASDCGLVAARVARGDGQGRTIFDEWSTANAIDWAWDEGEADVLSCSWGGGLPRDTIARAIRNARTKGRHGKGTVVVFAAGNNDGPVSFPGSLDEVVTVGASNQWDQRKSKRSKDGEKWWGSNFGKSLDLLAPGVAIATTDIHGAAGYGPGDFTLTFNGTSAATPQVAAAAALILSQKPELTETQVKDVLIRSADRLVAKPGWNKFVGWGRLNIFSALRLAWRQE